MKKIYVLSLLCLASGLVSAQDVIYRCGNEYTNNVSQAKAKGCKPVDGSGVTVIHGTRPSGGNAGAAPVNPRPAGSSASSQAAPARADSAAQKARDSDARAILQGEPEQGPGQTGRTQGGVQRWQSRAYCAGACAILRATRSGWPSSRPISPARKVISQASSESLDRLPAVN